jgi:acyl transferase domain-containing protein
MSDSSNSIAIVGVSALFPGSIDKTGFWNDIYHGNDLIQDVPETHWLVSDYYDPDPSVPDKTYANRGAFLKDVDFDAISWGIPPSIMPATDTTQLLALIVANRVLQDATGSHFETMDRSRVSVILGVTSAQELLGLSVARLQRPIWVKALREAGVPEDEVDDICQRIADHYTPWQESTFPGLLGNVVAGRIANRLNLGGTNCVTDAACASTFSAISMGVSELLLGDSDLVITGGADTLNDIFMFMCFSKTPALSKSGDCRPFAADGDGTMLGEGLGMVALKRLADAERDGDKIYAVMKGIGSSSDGRSKSVYAPVSKGQSNAIKRAYKKAGYSPSTVELLEAHGTGTVAGDAAEFNGLRLAFEGEGEGRNWCALGSVKSQIGHTKAAAGAAGLFKAVMALHHKVLPSTLKISEPNPKLNIEESPFYLGTERRPWVRGSKHPRRAGVSSFGFGGSNFHITVEEYTGKNRPGRLNHFEQELVVLCANSASKLTAAARALRANAPATPDALRSVALRTHAEYDATASHRLAVLASSLDDLGDKLSALSARITEAPEVAFDQPDGSAYGFGEAGSVAFLFPGQGSQHIGMGGELATSFDACMAVWDQCADIDFDGASLDQVVYPRTSFEAGWKESNADRLRETQWAQPAIGAASASQLALLKQIGIAPKMTGGHSYGELAALYCAGAWSLEDFMAVSRTRGELMANASTEPGSMLALRMGADEARALIIRHGVELVVANHNAPNQVVVSGATSVVDAFVAKLEADGVAAKKLPVGTAFHSPLVAGSSQPFAEALEHIRFTAPNIPVFSGVTAEAHGEAPDGIRRILSEQIASPIRFVEMVEAMHTAGARTFIEVGPKSVLTGLAGKILSGRDHTAISMERRGKSGTEGLLLALAKMVAAGVPMSLGRLFTEYADPIDPNTHGPPKMAIPINGSNYGKPYPPKGGTAALPRPNPPRLIPIASPPALAQPRRVVAPAAPSAVKRPQSLVALSAPNKQRNPAPPLEAPMSSNDDQRAPAGAVSAEWLAAYQETQRRTAEMQSAYQAAMAQSHAAYLAMAQASLASLAGAVGAPVMGVPAVAPPAPLAAPAFAPITTPRQAPVAAATVAVPHSAPQAVEPTLSGESRPDIRAVLMAVVSDATGYPIEMLGLEMALEGDLGIDSIKRVEILSELQDRVPHLPDVDAAEMGSLETLGEIVSHVEGQAGLLSTAPLPSVTGNLSPAPAQQSNASVRASSGTADVRAIMLAVVSESTGYPVEMLGLEMALEGDLGIDSIKRVEILSEVQDRVPSLPDVDAAQMGSLETLGEIVDYLASLGGTAPNTASSPASSVKATKPSASLIGAKSAERKAADVESIMLQVVSDSTGYPTDMLGREMALEGDLGIDSIKRVEILSAVQERVPELPEVDAGRMGSLETLGEIVDYMQSLLPGAEASAPSEKPSVSPSKAEAKAALSKAKPPKHAPAATKVSAPVPSEKPATKTARSSKGERKATKSARKATKAARKASERPAPAPAPAVLTERPALGRYAQTLVSSPATGLAIDGLFNGPVHVTSDGGDLNEKLVAELRLLGVNAIATQRPPADSDACVFLGGLRPADSPEAGIAVTKEAFLAAKTLAPRLSEEGGLFVTVQDTGGSFALEPCPRHSPYLAGLAALVRTASQEWPSSALKCVDISRASYEDTDALAKALAEELIRGGIELEVALNEKGRRTLRSELVPVIAGTSPIEEGDVIIVSGGARGVTAACMKAWAKASKPRLVLLGRTRLEDEPAEIKGIDDDVAIKRALLELALAAGEVIKPAELGARARRIRAGREIQQTLDEIRAAGSEVRYETVDVTLHAKVGDVFAKIREEWGPISGIVHAAGVLADKRIIDKSTEDFAWVFNTKVEGLRALLAASEDDDLKLFSVFSSVSARCGNNGQSDYAMANEVLARVALIESRKRPNARVKSFGWGPWEGGMVTPSLKTKFASLGVPMIPLDVGAQMFVDEISGEGADVDLVFGGEPNPKALLVVGADERVVHAAIRVHKDTHGYLVDHSIEGLPVVPVVTVVDWFARTIRSGFPRRHLVALNDVKVMKGIRLDDFETRGDFFEVSAVEADDTVSLELTGADGSLCYRATATLSDEAPTPNDEIPELSPRRWSGEVYGNGVLFHGGVFQVIDHIDGISDEGAVATIRGVNTAGWPSEPWAVDVAALDGGLQLALLFTKHALGGPSLPTSIDSIQIFGEAPTDSEIRCVAVPRKLKKSSAITDIFFVDADGRNLAQLTGVRTHLLPPKGE